MTVYEFLKQGVQNHSADNIRCNLEKHSIWIGTKAIVLEGRIVAPRDVFPLDGLIHFTGDPYAEIERLYAQYKRSVPNRHERLNVGYFKALSSDTLSMDELMNNPPRPQARLELEGFILLASAAGLIPWRNPKHFFWQSQSDPDCILYRDWIITNDKEANE